MTYKSTKKSIIAILLVIIIITSGLFLLAACDSSGNSPKLFTRNANTNDISIDVSQEISLSMTYKVIPNVDIDDLEITFKYYDSNKKVLSTKVKHVGNVKKGVQISVSISLGEFSFWDLFKISSTTAQVSAGTVSYF